MQVDPMEHRAHSRDKGKPVPEESPRRSHRHAPEAGQKNAIDLRRYRRVRWFFAKLLWQAILWDVVFALPILRWFRSDPLIRWQTAARQYRELATSLGGILIKLGQFLSTRVDILPREVTQELAGLQDEVAPDRFEDVVRVIEDDFGCPISELFTPFSRDAVGSASLAQAHRAVLPSGEEVVVKVLRPRIHLLVETDLNAMQLVCKWLKLFKRIRNRMDLDLLLNEFATTTWHELDMIMEKDNIKRFAVDFKDNPHVDVPKIYEQYCNASVLTLENVAYIKISDIEAAKACGIQCALVADRLYDIYMHQIFVTNFVHVDPHPGNIFIKPLPSPEETANGVTAFAPGESVPMVDDRPFQLIFIDFGMTAIISERLKTAMRMAVIGLGTQDVHKIVQAYVVAGALRRGADMRRLEEAHQEWLQKIWGLRLGKMQETALRELRYFMREYRDLIMETPFQVEADMLFIGRATGILAGLTTTIDPEFDPWTKTFIYAKRFAKEELTEDWQGVWEELLMLGKQAWKIPAHLEQVLARTKQGALAVQVSLSQQTRKAIRRIDSSVRRFAWMVITAALLISGVNLHIAGKDRPFGVIMIVLSILTFLWAMRR